MDASMPCSGQTKSCQSPGSTVFPTSPTELHGSSFWDCHNSDLQMGTKKLSWLTDNLGSRDRKEIPPGKTETQ